RHEQDAEDAFQAAFLVLARKAGSIRRQASVGPWLHEVAYHLALKARAAARPRQTSGHEVPELLAAEPNFGVTVRDLRQVIHEELRALPEKYRAPLVLYYLEGRSQEEVACHLGWSKWRLKGRLERGRAHLRRRLARRGLTSGCVVVGVVPAAV